MASPKSILTIAIGRMKDEPTEKKEEAGECCIAEMVERIFTTRNLAHFAHWKTNSYAAHQALGELYDALVSQVDDIVETYQGEFSLLEGLETCEAKLDRPILDIIKEDAAWIKANRSQIANGSKSIENMVDGLNACYSKIIYKLTNLA